jgi:nickel-dependent lactate racemase
VTVTEDQIAETVADLVASGAFDGRRVVVLVPDATRSAPMPLLARLVGEALAPRASSLDWMIALGTHQPLDALAQERLLGRPPGRVWNHAWDDPTALVSVGFLQQADVERVSRGLLNRTVEVRMNRIVAEADVALVCGPVFPHEVVGFSGGNKYFFPGVSGPEVIDATHWLGALVTSRRIIGTLGTTPVRALIDQAASLLSCTRKCLAFVVEPGGHGLAGIWAGTPEEAWRAAAECSARVNVRRVPHAYQTVLSLVPARYDDLWTGAKGMYKVEPVVADGGEVIIYAPHITRTSVTHGDLLASIGYHVRDYFVGQWPRFSEVPGGVLAHSTHLRGEGTWDPVGGERARIAVTLATGIDRATCESHGLGYRNPTSIDLAEWSARARTDPSLLVVPEAGEVLFRLAGE